MPHNNRETARRATVVNPNRDSGGQGEDASYDNTRRQFVVGSAGALGGLAVGGTFAGSVLAQDGEGEDGGDEEMPEDMFEDDVAILNYALTLEYLEASFYRQGLENISEEDLCNCKALSEDSHLREVAYGELQTILAHEEEHVETLVSVIQSLDGEPIEEPEFDFGLAVQYPMAFLATAAQLEDVGVSAYAGAAPSIQNPDLVPPALSIHSVEARHASFLRTLTDQSGFPNTFDEARTKAEVLELAGPFIVTEDDDDGETNMTMTEEPTTTDVPTGNETDAPPGSGNQTNSS